MRSKDYKVLQTRLAAETEALHRKWADSYAIVVDTWNCDTLLRCFHIAVCRLLNQTAKVFIAQLNIHSYMEDEAIINLLTANYATVLHTPLPTDNYTKKQMEVTNYQNHQVKSMITLEKLLNTLTILSEVTPHLPMTHYS